MMKRVVSLMTSLMMMASLIGGSVVPSTTVSAAGEQPVFSLEDTSVLNGVMKTSVPVKVSSTDLAAAIVSLEITSDKDGEEAPVISGVREGVIPSVQANSKIKAPNKRSFSWNATDAKGKLFNNDTIAYVDVELPDTAKTGSTYTLTATNVDPANETQDKDYSYSEDSKLSAKIKVVAPVAVKGYITNMDDQDVKAGSVVAVPMTIECPTDISALVAKFSVDNGATIEKFVTSNTTLNSALYQTSKSNPGLILWGPKADGKGESFKTAKTFATVLVKIPSDAKTGTKYTVSLDTIDTSSPAQDYLEPEKYAAATLTVVENKATDGLSFEVGSANVKAAQKTVKVPVYLSYTAANEGIAAVIAKFQITNKDNKKAEIVSIEAGSAALDGQFQNSVSVPEKALWNSKNTKNKSFAINADGSKPVLFVLNVTLPENIVAGDEFVVSTIDGSLDIVDENQVNLLAAETAGKIVVTSEESILDGYKISMGSKEVTETGKTLTVDVPVYLDGAQLTSFVGTFKVSNGAVIKSITSEAYGNEITFGKDNANHVLWHSANGQDTTFTADKAFAVITVEIPAELAQGGKTFVVSMDGTVDSANADRITVYPTEPYGVGVITVNAKAEAPKSEIGMKIGSATAKPGETVTIPVNVDVKNLSALDGKFTISDEYKGYAIVTSVKTKVENADISVSQKNPGGFVWTTKDTAGIDFTYDTDFIVLEVKVADSAPAGQINVGFEGDGITAIGADLTEAVISTLTPGIITVKSDVTEPSDTTTQKPDETTVTTADSSTVSTTVSTIESQPTESSVTTVGSVTSVSSDTVPSETTVTTVSSTLGSVSSTSETTVTTVGSVTSVSSDTQGSVTSVTTVASIPDVSAVVTASAKVSEAVGTDVTAVGDGFEVKAEKVVVKKGDKTANVKVNLAGFNGKDEHFEYASLKFALPEGFKIVSCEPASKSIMTAASSAINAVAGNTVELSLVNTYNFADGELFTLVVEVPQTAAAGEYAVTFDKTNSSFRKVVATSAAADAVVAKTAKISNVTYTDGSITISPATETSKKIVDGSFKVTNPTSNFYYAHADKFDLTGLKVTVDVVTTYSDGTTKTETVDITNKVTVADKATPASTYNKKAFKYAVDLVFTDAELAAEGIKAGSFDALIGQKGDITLDHKVTTLDGTTICIEFLEKDMLGKTTLEELVKTTKFEDGLLETVGVDTLVKFATFLADADENGKLQTVDATMTFIFFLEADMADGDFNVATAWQEILKINK